MKRVTKKNDKADTNNQAKGDNNDSFVIKKGKRSEEILCKYGFPKELLEMRQVLQAKL